MNMFSTRRPEPQASTPSTPPPVPQSNGSFEPTKSRDYRMVIAESPITMEFLEIRKKTLDVIKRMGALGVAR